MNSAHGTSCLNKFLKHWEVYCYFDYTYEREIFTFMSELSKYPARFKPLYKINLRLK